MNTWDRLCAENCKMIVLIILLTASFTHGRSIITYEDNTEMLDSNRYVDDLLARIRTRMSSLDPVRLRNKQNTNDKGYYAFSNTTLTGLSTLYRTGDSETSTEGENKLITVNFTANRLLIDGTLRAENSLDRDLRTHGRATGGLNAPVIRMVIRVTPNSTSLESYQPLTYPLIDSGRFSGYRTANLEDLLSEAMDYEFGVLYSVYMRDIVEKDLKELIERVVRESSYHTFTY